MSQIVHWHCIARGRAQGVGCREDGTMFIGVQGAHEPPEAFLRDVSGPQGASHVHDVERVADVVASPNRVAFEIRRGLPTR